MRKDLVGFGNCEINFENSFYRLMSRDIDLSNIDAMENTLGAPPTSQILNKNVVSENVEPNGENRVEENNAKSSTGKPKTTRAIVYEFFKWDDETNQYNCSLCEYVSCLLHFSLMIVNYFLI